MVRLIAPVALILLAACTGQGSTDKSERQSNSPSLNSHEPAAVDAQSSSASETQKLIGQYRWSDGLQMGVMWAAVTNRRGDSLRFEAEPDQDGNVAWSVPSVEIADADQAKKILSNDQMNFVIGDKGWIFSFEFDGTTFTPTPMSGSGHSDALELVREIENSRQQMVCVEFPRSDYRTCFSLAGASEAVGMGEENVP